MHKYLHASLQINAERSIRYKIYVMHGSLDAKSMLTETSYGPYRPSQ